MPFRATSFSTYQRYIRENLPEYELQGTSIPSPPSAVVLLLRTPASMKYKSGAPPFATVQPARLEFSGEARFGQIKHYKTKRDKIIEYLSRDCPRRDLFLKSYNKRNDFTVGLQTSGDEDVKYQHLALLKANTASLTGGFMFYARRFFGATTPDQKKALINKYMAAHCQLHELVHFEHNNLFFIARKDSATGLGSGTNNIEGIFNFKSASGEWIEVQGTMLTSMSQLTAYSTDISGPLSTLWNEHKIAGEVARYTRVMEEAGFVGRDPFQKIVAEVETEMRGGLLHDASKGLKEAVFGKHCRTHPVRATRMALSKIFGIVKLAIPGVLRQAGFNAAKAVADTVIDRADTDIQVASTAATGTSAAIGERAVPRWVQDIGLSASEDELNTQHWAEIQEHINSLEKWEQRFGDIEATIRTKGRDVVTCVQMNELLRCYAKIQYHLDKLVECYEREIAGLGELGRLVTETKLSLAGFEDAFKSKAVQFLNTDRLAKLKTKSGGQTVFQTGGTAYKCYQISNLLSSDANLDTFLSNNAELRSGETAMDNDVAEISAED